MSALLPVAEAQARLIALARPLPLETVRLSAAAGRWAAAPLSALRTQPFADLSAMDGYALRFADLPGPLEVIAESAAGSALPPPLPPGTAMRIFTGAPMPDGADTILVQEDAERDGALVRLRGEGPGRAGKHVRRKGYDFSVGDVVIRAGLPFTPARIALAAAAGHGSLPVRRRTRIALISTGNELVPPGSDAPPHCLPASNTPMLETLLGGPAAEIVDLGIAPDRQDAILERIAAAGDCDIIITTGGASVGDHDLVKPAFEAAGARLDFWKVAMRPGKPIMAGTLDGRIILGLPGNPVSAFVTASLFAIPLVAALGGASTPVRPSRIARLAAPVPANGIRAQYLRGNQTPDGVAALDEQDSAALTALADATLLIVRPASAPAAEAGSPTEIIDIA